MPRVDLADVLDLVCNYEPLTATMSELRLIVLLRGHAGQEPIGMPFDGHNGCEDLPQV
jgi:hypothetical protein